MKLLTTLLILLAKASAFCGFYVAGAGADLYNQASEVILARHGNYTAITMSNDFRGDVKDFAMVVPVPVVLQRDQIQIVDPQLFNTFDAYSQPRLVEYWDDDPCIDDGGFGLGSNDFADFGEDSSSFEFKARRKALGVKIEAKYQIGEYNILLLSGTQSKGLATWLKENGYSLPGKAARVLRPYIKNQMKFFVVKVNLEKQKQQGFNALRPIQIRYEHPRFMLPIRLGMANASGPQDLTIYALTEGGQIETANYRMAEVPTDYDIPLFVKNRFGAFYQALFDRSYQMEGKKAAFLEYSWDLSSSNFTKCDPCSSDPPNMADLLAAGVNWLEQTNGGDGWNSSSAHYKGSLHFTRIHVRYTEQDFPEDLMFVETNDRSRFQARYVLHHPATGNLDCEEAVAYKKKLRRREMRERLNLAALTGWKDEKDAEDKGSIYVAPSPDDHDNWPILWPVVLVSLLLALPRLFAYLELSFRKLRA